MKDLSASLVEFYDRMSSWEAGVVKGTGLTLPQMHCVEALGAYGPLRMKDLAARLGVTMGTLTVMVDRLSDQGLMERKQNEEDGRSYWLSLTPSGEALHQKHHRHHETLSEELTAGFSKAEKVMLQALLQRVNKGFH